MPQDPRHDSTEHHSRQFELDGIEVLEAVHDTDYGSHQFGVRDADGNLWTLGTYRGA